MKNVNSFLLIFCLLLIHIWYSISHHRQILTPATSISKYPSLLTRFQAIAQDHNPVDISRGQVRVFLANAVKKNQCFPISDLQKITVQYLTYSPFSSIKERVYFDKIEMTGRNNAVFAKTISLNGISLCFANDKNSRDRKSQLIIIN